MAQLVNHPTPAPSRKIVAIGVVGSIASVVFAAAPQITHLIPAAGPWLALAQVVIPGILPVLGYSMKEWAPVNPAPHPA